jgi:hypothetical protein
MEMFTVRDLRNSTGELIHTTGRITTMFIQCGQIDLG